MNILRIKIINIVFKDISFCISCFERKEIQSKISTMIYLFLYLYLYFINKTYFYPHYLSFMYSKTVTKLYQIAHCYRVIFLCSKNFYLTCNGAQDKN
jgi:hypothetical protein